MYKRQVDHHGNILHLFIDHFQGIDHGGQSYHGRPVLIVMKYGDITLLFKPSFNLEAARGGYILKVNTAKTSGYQSDRVYDLVHILRFYEMCIRDRVQDHRGKGKSNQYKYGRHHRRGKKLFHIAEEPGGTQDKTVSYTHLDVYKRQLLGNCYLW